MNMDVMGVQEVSPGYEFMAGNPTVPVGYKQTEVGVIPEDWDVSTISGLASVTSGATPPRSFGERYFQRGTIPWVKTLDLNNGVIKATEEAVTEHALRETSIRLNPAGTVLVAMYGGYAQIGRTGYLIYPATTNQALSAIIPESKKLDSKYLLHVLNYRVEHWKSVASSSRKDPNITGNDVRAFTLPLPPVAEQRAIATALSDVDALLEELDRLIAKKRDIKQAVIQQLLTGETRLPGFEGAWERVALGDVAAFYKGKGLPKSAINTFGEQPCIHYGELFTQYGVKIEKIISRTDECFDSFLSVANDVLMPTSDVTPSGLAKASCVSTNNVILGGDILVIRTDPDIVNGVFLSSIIRKDADQVLRLVTGTTVYHLYGSDMQKFIFVIPSIAEQNAIVDTLADMDTEIQALEQRRSKTVELKQGMMQELLTGRTRLV